MNKSELIKTLAEKNGLHVDEAAMVVNTFFDSIKQSLVDAERVEIRGFGSFKVKDYGGYTGRNPKTGEIVQVKPKRLPFFRPGKELKDFVNKQACDHSSASSPSSCSSSSQHRAEPIC